MLASSLHSDPLSLCRQILTQFRMDDPSATIMPLPSGSGFSGAWIARVETGGKRYSLRRWPRHCPEPDRLQGLHRLLEWTWNAGVEQIAVPLQTGDGATLLSADNHWWQLEPWMPGTADFQRDPNRERLRASMHVLARWHIAARTFLPRASERHWFYSMSEAASPGLNERCQSLRQYLESGESKFRNELGFHPDPVQQAALRQIWMHFKSCAPGTLERLESLRAATVPIQPCLRDVWHDHLLFTGNELTGLIDPGACRSENVTTDLARLLGSLVGDDRSEWDFALNCYQTIRPLSLLELGLLSAFDSSGVLLSGMTWLDWLLVQRRTFIDREQIARRLDAIIRRLERLMDHNSGAPSIPRGSHE